MRAAVMPAWGRRSVIPGSTRRFAN